MRQNPNNLNVVVQKLEGNYGTPNPPHVTEPFEMILHENVAYLVDDTRRDEAFDILKKTLGTSPAEILLASPDQLGIISEFGKINVQGQIAKLVKAAQIARDDFDGDLTQVIDLPPKTAKAALKKFPGIGEPGAEQILLFNKKLAVPALESNGLRVLLRLGYGEDTGNYSATYRSVRDAISPDIPDDCDFLIKAHQLLREHGKTICKRSKPQCEKCPLKETCVTAKSSLLNYLETQK